MPHYPINDFVLSLTLFLTFYQMIVLIVPKRSLFSLTLINQGSPRFSTKQAFLIFWFLSCKAKNLSANFDKESPSLTSMIDCNLLSFSQWTLELKHIHWRLHKMLDKTRVYICMWIDCIETFPVYKALRLKSFASFM